MAKKKYYCRKCKIYHYIDSKKGIAHRKRNPKTRAVLTLKRDVSNKQFLYGDFDGDKIKNMDDTLPLKKSKRTVEETKLSDAMLKLQRIHRINEKKRPIIEKDFRRIVKKVNPNIPVRTLHKATPNRTKTPISLLHKSLKYQIPNTNDIIGLTYVGESKEELFRIKSSIENDKYFNIKEIKDYYRNPKEGYKALHLIVQDKRFYRIDGEEKQIPFTFEIQLKTRRMKKLNKASHTLYKKNQMDPVKFADLVNVVERADAGDITAKRFFDRLGHEDMKKMIGKTQDNKK